MVTGDILYEKQYLDQEPGPWFQISQQCVLQELQRSFVVPELLLTELHSGTIVYTAFARYRRRKEVKCSNDS